MADDMVKVHEMSADLYRLTDRVMTETDYRVRFVRCSGTGLHCRVYIAEGDQDLTDDGNVYSLYSTPSKWQETQHNYQRCKARLVRIITANKKALSKRQLESGQDESN